MPQDTAKIKIEFEMHGLKESFEDCIGYQPDEYSCMDSRVVEFFRQAYGRALLKRHRDIMLRREDEMRIEQECSERMQLKWLKEKYEHPEEPPLYRDLWKAQHRKDENGSQ